MCKHPPPPLCQACLIYHIIPRREGKCRTRKVANASVGADILWNIPCILFRCFPSDDLCPSFLYREAIELENPVRKRVRLCFCSSYLPRVRLRYLILNKIARLFHDMVYAYFLYVLRTVRVWPTQGPKLYVVHPRHVSLSLSVREQRTGRSDSYFCSSSR